MFKSFMLLSSAACFLLLSCGDSKEKVAPGDVPPAIVSSFSNAYPGAGEVQWEKEEEDGKIIYEAKFLYDGKKMDAEFDEAGARIDE
jgi:hypothetical protein